MAAEVRAARWKQNHLGAYPQAHIAGDAVRLVQFGELLRAERGDSEDRFNKLLPPQPTLPRAYLSLEAVFSAVCRFFLPFSVISQVCSLLSLQALAERR